MMKKIWRRVSTLGLKESQTLSEQKKLILTNQISVLLFSVLITLLIFTAIATGGVSVVSFVICSLIITIPWMNHKGLYRITSFMMSVIFPVNVLIFSSILKVQMSTEKIDIIYHFVPRFMLLGGLVLPLILIGIRHWYFLLIAVTVNMACLLMYDTVSHWFGVGINDMPLGWDKYPAINYLIVLPWLLILLGFIFLQSINNKYEKRILELNSDLSSRNILLNQQKEEISSQRDEIEAQRDTVQKQKGQLEVILKDQTDSIHYARHIQTALLPGRLDEYFKSYGLLFRPKDIVSGDFYWAGKVADNVIFTVADCTGHGVPGAFMSMLGVSVLNKLVNEQEIHSPGEILGKMRDNIISALNQKEGEPEKDGLDMALCCLNTTTMQLSFSGANNPCRILRSSENGTEVIELAPDKMPVAIYERMDGFTEKQFQLAKGDLIVLMSDGLEDQFGGEKGKKLKAVKVKEWLVESSVMCPEKMAEHINAKLTDWMTGQEQTDDITMLAVKID
jgi:serine phosphatase RsbU (regulator of sigma subunit)